MNEMTFLSANILRMLPASLWHNSRWCSTSTLGLLTICFVFANDPGVAEECAQDPLPCIVRVLEQQKTNGEEMARLLRTYARDDASKEATGITLYVAARAAFDGLIEEMKVDIDRARSPASGPELNNAVLSAVGLGQAFAAYVNEILPKGSARFPLDISAILKGGGELIKSLVDASIAIWDKFHDRGNEEKERIRTQLERLKWKSFNQATA
jgi:hypothetical protein